MLAYNKDSKRLFYVEHYTNNIYCIDTNLNLIYHSNTIDTTTTSDLNVKTIMLGEYHKITPTAPSFVVNRYVFASKDYLFIMSGLKSDNESVLGFKNNSPVDVYSSTTGKYLKSFQLPDLKGKKATSISISNDILVALYNDCISTYKLDLNKVRQNDN